MTNDQMHRVLRQEPPPRIGDNAPIRVRLIGKHPHAGETGHIEVNDGDVTVHHLPGCEGRLMFRVELDDCKHGTDACFAEKSDLEVYRLGIGWCREGRVRRA